MYVLKEKIPQKIQNTNLIETPALRVVRTGFSCIIIIHVPDVPHNDIAKHHKATLFDFTAKIIYYGVRKNIICVRKNIIFVRKNIMLPGKILCC
jgi:hypothetical protein